MVSLSWINSVEKKGRKQVLEEGGKQWLYVITGVSSREMEKRIARFMISSVRYEATYVVDDTEKL